MELHRQQRRGIWRAQQALGQPGARVCTSWSGLGGGLPGGPGWAGHIKPLCSDPLADWLLHAASCSLSRWPCRCSGLLCKVIHHLTTLESTLMRRRLGLLSIAE